MKYPALIFLFLAGSLPLAAQFGFQGSKDVNKVDIPFEYENHMLVVKVTFNRIFPLKFIFDTGAENTILSKREITDLLNVKYEREFKLIGSDLKTELTAYLVRGIHLTVGEMVLPNHSMLVLDDDYFRLDELMGVNIHGILGADVFRGLVVKINFERKVITLMRANHFDPPKKNYEVLPLDVFRNKPYLRSDLQVASRDSTFQIKLLLDTGAALSLLLNTDTHPSLKLPPKTLKGNIGAGLGGYLEGYLGRVKGFRLGAIQFKEMLTNFQELQEGIDTSILHGRNGILGTHVLERFHLIIDYPHEILYLQPNKHFKEAFEFDKSGLVILATGVGLNKFIVHEVLPGSPAYEAGVLPGDEIKRINFSSAGFLSLHDVHRIFRKKEGKKICLIVKRDNTRIKMQFRLRKLI